MEVKTLVMVENMLIWHVVVNAQFRCVALILVASHQNFVMSDHRKNFFRWLLSVLFCCWNSSNSFTESSGNSRNICVTERIEMGPMTLRDYINTLEPYDPEKHGWRGEEPWRYRIRYKEPPIQSVDVISEFKNNCHQLNSYQHTNHVVYHETPV